MREKGKEARERWKDITNDCLWIEERQIWHPGKWQFIKVKGKIHIRIFNFNWVC